MPLVTLLAALVLGQSPPTALPEISFDPQRAQAQDPGSTIVAEEDPFRQVLVRAALAKAFARYPKEFLVRNVKAVFVVRDMADDGAPFGGTTGDDGDSVVITDGDDSAVDEAWVETVFHHETSHVLMENYGKAFSRRAWKDATARDFHYAHGQDGGYWAIRDGEDDDTFRPDLNAQGPLNAYGASCFDEDWAIYAQNVLAPSEEFTDVVRRYPLVAKRAALVEGFYERICPGWKPSPFASALGAIDRIPARTPEPAPLGEGGVGVRASHAQASSLEDRTLTS